MPMFHRLSRHGRARLNRLQAVNAGLLSDTPNFFCDRNRDVA